jgi:hypothetical protein
MEPRNARRKGARGEKLILPPSIADWPALWRERYEERAAIMELEGNRTRNDAELFAEYDIRQQAKKEA